MKFRDGWHCILGLAADCSYNYGMHFEWDERKNQSNRAKHGISFETARLVFDDPRAISIQDRHENNEERWQTLGRIGRAVILLVAHTFREGETGEETVRIVSARKTTPKERRIYDHDER